MGEFVTLVPFPIHGYAFLKTGRYSVARVELSRTKREQPRTECGMSGGLNPNVLLPEVTLICQEIS